MTDAFVQLARQSWIIGYWLWPKDSASFEMISMHHWDLLFYAGCLPTCCIWDLLSRWKSADINLDMVAIMRSWVAKSVKNGLWWQNCLAWQEKARANLLTSLQVMLFSWSASCTDPLFFSSLSWIWYVQSVSFDDTAYCCWSSVSIWQWSAEEVCTCQRCTHCPTCTLQHQRLTCAWKSPDQTLKASAEQDSRLSNTRTGCCKSLSV